MSYTRRSVGFFTRAPVALPAPLPSPPGDMSPGPNLQS